jgi:hypothetical protein
MKFSTDPESAEQSATKPAPSNVLTPGIYPFKVLQAADETSRAGNDMIHLKLGVERHNGTDQWVHDYIVATQPHKLKALCRAVGMLDLFDTGEITAAQLVGASGKVKVKIEPPKGSWPEKNTVDEYVERRDEQQEGSSGGGIADEEIPF